MDTLRFRYLAVVLVLTLVGTAHGAGRYLEVRYPPSGKPGELHLGVTYTLWVHDGVRELRGIIVHQHGCGSRACKASSH